MRDTPNPTSQPHEITADHATYFLLQVGFTEETLSEMEGAEIVAEMMVQYQQIQSALQGSIQLFETQRWMLYFTPLRWRWKDIDMYGWRLLHKGPFFPDFFFTGRQ